MIADDTKAYIIVMKDIRSSDVNFLIVRPAYSS